MKRSGKSPAIDLSFVGQLAQTPIIHRSSSRPRKFKPDAARLPESDLTARLSDAQEPPVPDFLALAILCRTPALGPG